MLGKRWFPTFLAAALVVVGCSAPPTPVPTLAATPLPPIGRSDPTGTVRASGKVVPARAAGLAFATSGRVQSLDVDVGDRVEAGAVLVSLEDAATKAAVAQAEAALARAQAALDEIRAGPHPQVVAAAQARADAAAAHLAQLTESPRPADIAAAQAELAAAQARYDKLYAEPDPSVVAAARAQVQQAQATLDRLQNPATAGQIAEAEANLRSARAELELLSGGARSEAIAAAVAVVDEAAAALQQAEAGLVDTQLRAPFAGVVTAVEVSPGEMVVPGGVVVVLADLSRLQVETTDLSERDVVHVMVDGPVIVLVEALATEVSGRVNRIASQASVIGGDVVYTVVIDLDQQPADLRWGMSAEVEIISEPADPRS